VVVDGSTPHRRRPLPVWGIPPYALRALLPS
jgi:hypothetical protein